jgi:hypothetical protein
VFLCIAFHVRIKDVQWVYEIRESKGIPEGIGVDQMSRSGGEVDGKRNFPIDPAKGSNHYQGANVE